MQHCSHSPESQTAVMKKHLQQKNASHPSSKDDENPPNIDIGASTVRRNPSRHARPRMYGATPAKDSASISTKSSSVPIPFHIDDLVQQEIPPPKKSVTSADASENMKVFLRIRPLNVKRRDAAKNADKIGGIRGKGIITKKHEKCTKKKSRDQEACLVVNGTNSVTLTPPTAYLAGAKRAKCEVYDGFSHVFTSESLQGEVYKLVMGPLIRDFMEGKSGMLAAMGPTGSGKTHTLFGTTREPGLVPLALQQLFCEDTKTDCSFALRSYCISMFEICSTQGKSERIFDLSIGGLDSSPQQSTIEGVQEVMISSITEAESVIACGMLKRATAVTDANDQSSRSQCIINIRHALKSSRHNHDKLKTAIFTIVDLAGAEKERRIGIQSLLEHQKNRKRTLQKHFLNSQLTKYLRDYFEGKKRMTLLITAKPGEDDYPNTSFLLRQVSPYMKIKFTIEEFPDAQNLKRSIVLSSRLDLAKRRKHNDSKADRIRKNEPPTLIKEADARDDEDTTIPDHSVLCSDSVENFHEACDDEHHADIQRLKRECHIMNCFMRALWNVLKEYKQKVEVADEEVIEARRLKESLRNACTENILLKQELEDLWSLCSLRDSSSLHSISVQESDIPSIPWSEMNMMCDGNLSKKVEVDRTKVNKDPKSTSLEREPISEIQEKLGKNEAMSLPPSTQSGKECSELIVTSSMENDTVHREDEKVSSISTDLCFHVKDVENKPNDETFSEDGISLAANVETADKAFRKKSPLQVAGNISRELNVDNKPKRRLLPPASAMLLKEFSGLDLDDRNAKGKKEAGGRKESQRLLQLLQSAKK